MNEYEKMLSGQLYNATDPGLIKGLNRCKDLCWEYNQIRPTDIKTKNAKLQEILGQADEDTYINQPFLCDYGKHILVGKRFFANFNFVVLDEAMVTIGDDCFIGPNVSIYTACHSTDPIERNTRQEWALPVNIGNNCWLGGSVTILPGVTIGDNVTIGAGSVVVKDIPSNSVAVGNPARVVKRLDVAQNDQQEDILLTELFATFKSKGYTSEDFYGGCALCGDANDFALDIIDEAVLARMPEATKFDRDRLTSKLYSQLNELFEKEEFDK